MTGRDCLRYMHKNAALINRGRIGHLIGHLIGLGTAHEFLRERIRGPCACTYAVITLVPWLYLLHEASGCRTPRHRMPIASRIFPIFHLLSTLSPPPPPFIFLLRQGNLAVFPSRFAFSSYSFAYLLHSRR